MSEKNYESSGGGYFHDPEDPSKGDVGIPYEEEIFQEELLIHKAEATVLRLKALGLLHEAVNRDIPHKIAFLKKLGYKGFYVKGKKISLEKGSEYPNNLDRMYQRTIDELKELRNNPYKKCTLADRVNELP